MTDTDRRSRRSAARQKGAPQPQAPQPPIPSETSGLRPWHFFLLATASLATVSAVLMRHQTAEAIALVGLTVCAAGYAGYAMFRTLDPLVGAGTGEDAVMLGGRTRAALERDKGLVLRAIKELEFDHAMGKVADGDFAEMRDRLRQRAMRLMRQLDGAAAYRAAIERDVAARLPAAPPPPVEDAAEAAPAAGFFCTQCGARAEADARFCKMCGRALHATV